MFYKEKILHALMTMALIILVSCSGGSEDEVPSLLTPPDNEAPTITTVTAPVDGTYIYNQNLLFSVTFSENIFVSGVPSLEISIDGSNFNIPVSSGHGTSVLVFDKNINLERQDIDGIDLNTLNLNGGSIKDASGNNAVISIAATNYPAVLVDSIRPIFTSSIFNSGEAYTNNSSAIINSVVTNADEMIVSSASDCSTGTFVAYDPALSHTLTINTVNSVYVQFQTTGGNKTACTNISITHDDQAPNTPVISLTGDASNIASDSTSWTAVADNGPSGILRYEFAISTTTDESGIITGGGWQNIALATSSQITSGITLSAATNYYSLVKVIDNALNQIVTASAAWQITIPPNPITNLEASDRTTESITLGWSVPVSNGIPVTDYQIEYKGNGVTVWTLINDGVSPATSYVHTSLIPATEYQYRVRAYNGSSYSAWSNTLTVETLPDLPFFEPGFKAINVGGATTNSVVSFADGNDIYLNGVLVTTLNKSDTYVFASTDFDVLEGTQAFFVAGRLGSTAGGASSANVTWLTQAWVGKEYFFNLTRNGPLKVKIFAFEDTTVTINQGGTTVAGPQFIAADSGYTFTLATNASYQLSSTGFIGGYVYANQGGSYYDPRPLIPSSTDLIGFPSNSANFTSGTSSNNYNYIHADGVTGSGTLSAGVTQNINPSGAANLYSGNSLRIMSQAPIAGISTADSNGLAAAPFMPVSMLKTNFGINVDSDWIAFASDRPVTITQTLPNGTTSSFSLTRTSTTTNTPYRYYIAANQLAGTLYSGDDKFQMWYEPESTNGGAIEDETVAFGWD